MMEVEYNEWGAMLPDLNVQERTTRGHIFLSLGEKMNSREQHYVSRIIFRRS